MLLEYSWFVFLADGAQIIIVILLFVLNSCNDYLQYCLCIIQIYNKNNLSINF